jgi:hypothetical protein
MEEQHPARSRPENRNETRQPPGKYYSVQFSIKELAYIYQFKIWNESPHGLCILVNQDSDILKHIAVGDRIEMKYYVSESVGTTEAFKTEIRHITKVESGRFKAHVFVGLLIMEG